MIITNEVFQKYVQQCLQCMRVIILLCENEWTCISWESKIIKKKNYLGKLWKEIKF